jgi:DNA-binding NarL/FixJ family response regulator
LESNLRVLVAVTPDALTRVIVHLLRAYPEIEIVCCVQWNERLVRHAERLLPHIIIVNAIDMEGSETVAALKNASPGSKLILTSWGDRFAVRRRLSNVDAHINEAFLVRKLLPTVRRLCASHGHKVPQRSIHRRYQ